MLTINVNVNSSKSEKLQIESCGPHKISFSSNSTCSVITLANGAGSTVYQLCVAHGSCVDLSIEQGG